MTGQIFTIIVLTLFVSTSSTPTNPNKDLKLNSFRHSLVRRYLANEDVSFQQRGAIEFTDEERQFQKESLDIHNVLRARHCVPPLVLDEEINIRAKVYANFLASEDKGLVHSSNRGSRFGENLYSLTRKSPITDLPAEKVVRAWYGEYALYNYSNPRYSFNTGHFSQIVWKDTKRLGIAYTSAREGRKRYVVAQYGPPGNYNFQFAICVLEPKC